MTTVSGAWSEEENAWVSERLSPKGDIYLTVQLPSYGYVTARQRDKATGKAPRCYQSKEGKAFKLRIGHSEQSDIQIFTSVTPSVIKYANI